MMEMNYQSCILGCDLLLDDKLWYLDPWFGDPDRLMALVWRVDVQNIILDLNIVTLHIVA